MEKQFRNKLPSVKSVLQSDKTKHFKVGHPALQKNIKDKLVILIWRFNFFQEESSGRKESSPTGKSSSGSESPKPGRRRFGSTADEIDVTKLNGMAENAINNATSSGGTTATNAELEAMKQEILREMRKEMAKMKQDIIEGTFRIRKIFLPQLTLRT